MYIYTTEELVGVIKSMKNHWLVILTTAKSGINTILSISDEQMFRKQLNKTEDGDRLIVMYRLNTGMDLSLDLNKHNGNWITFNRVIT